MNESGSNTWRTKKVLRVVLSGGLLVVLLGWFWHGTLLADYVTDPPVKNSVLSPAANAETHSKSESKIVPEPGNSTTNMGAVSPSGVQSPAGTEPADTATQTDGPVQGHHLSNVALHNLIASGPARRMSLIGAIQLALKNNLDIQVKGLQAGIEEDRLTQAYGVFEPGFKVDGNWEKINTPQNAQEFVATGGTVLELNQLNGNPRIFHEDNFHFKESLGGKLPLGTTYEFFNQWDILRNDLNRDSALSLFSPEYGTFTGLNITQPLLKDFGTDVGMAQIRVQRKNILISKLDLKASLLATVANVVKNYLDLAFASENVKLRQEEVDLATKLTMDREDQLERGVTTSQDVSHSESALAEAVERLVEAEDDRLDRQNALLLLISQDVSIHDTSHIAPTSHLFGQKMEFDRDKLLMAAYNNRPDYLAALERVQRDQIKIIYAQNQMLPRIDFKGTVGYNGLADSGTDSITRAFNPQGPQYSVGFSVSVPIGNEDAIGKREEAKKEKQISIISLKQAEMNTILEINKALELLDANYKRLEAMRTFRKAADDNFADENTRLEKGLSSEMQLSKLHRDETEAKTRELAALADYEKALVSLYAADGTLLEHEGVVLEK